MERITPIRLGLNTEQKFQESLSKTLQDTEDDQYLGGQEAFSTNGTLAYRPRPFIKRAHTRVSASNSGAIQMLLVAAEGDQIKRKTFDCLLKSADAVLWFPL